MDKYSIINPHPAAIKPSGFVAGGRGGAGNYRRFTASDLTHSPMVPGPESQLPPTKPNKRPILEMPRFSSSSSTLVTSSSSSTRSAQRAQTSSRLASTGIGGAGNMFARADTEERVFLFDEEMVRRRDRPCAPVYHIGRGGGGNWVSDTDDDQHQYNTKPRTTRMNSNGSDTASDSSGGSIDHDTNAQVRRTVGGALGRLRNRLTS